MDWTRFVLAAIPIITISLLYREHRIASARCRMLISKYEKAMAERAFIATEGMNAAVGFSHVDRENIFMRYRRSFLMGHKSEWSLERLLREVEVATEEEKNDGR